MKSFPQWGKVKGIYLLRENLLWNFSTLPAVSTNRFSPVYAGCESMVTSLTSTWKSTPSNDSTFLEPVVDLVKNFLPVETSTKLTLLSLGCISFFTNYPCLALKRGLVLLITYKRPRRRTTWQSGWRFLRVLIEDATFISHHYGTNLMFRQLRSLVLLFNCQRKKIVHDGKNVWRRKNTY